MIGNLKIAEIDMDLILWRHADAEEGSVIDVGRKLTAKGEIQAQLMGKWLKSKLPEKFRVLASPTKRTQQTAQALTKTIETVKSIGPGADAISILAAAGWPDAKGTIVVVGHQPTLARVAAFLLAGEEADWNMKKGNVWWLSNRVREARAQTVLKVMMSPEYL
jgi:phosphohistidine phosphatase